MANTQRVPAYVIFADRSLLEMAKAQADDDGGFERGPRVGQAKLAQYGEAFLAVVRDHVEQTGRAAQE